jgi:hypothetical protein
VLDQYGEPDSAFTVLDGDAMGFDHVNLEMLNALHEQD